MDDKPHNTSNRYNQRILWWAIWSVSGTCAVIISFLLGYSIKINEFLKEWYSGHPFYLREIVFSPSPLVLFAFNISITLFFTQVLLTMDGFFRRIALLLSALCLITITMPVCALWGVYLPVYPILLSLLIAGTGATITAPFLKKPIPANKNS